MPVARPLAGRLFRVAWGLFALLAAGLAGCGSEASKPTAPVGGSGRFVDEREGQPFRHLVVEGTPYEMGWHQGRLLREEIRARLERWKERFSELDPYVSEVRKLLPGAATDELDGVADGAGVNRSDVVRREILREVWRWSEPNSYVLCASFASAPGSVPAVAIAYDNFWVPATADAPWDSGADDVFRRSEREGKLLVERRPAQGPTTLVVGVVGSVGGWAGISSGGIAVGSCQDGSLPPERRSLRGMPFAAGVRFALEAATDAQTAFDALPRLVGNRVLIADATNRRIDALVGLSVVGYQNTEPNAWVLRPAGEGEKREKNEKAQQEWLGKYPTRPTAADAMDLAAAGRNAASTFPVLLLTRDGIEVRDAAGKTWTYGWTR